MLLITGATGHSGSHLIKSLHEICYKKPIKCIVREKSDLSLINSLSLNIECCSGDLNDFEFVDKCMNEITEIIHIASIEYSENIVKAALKNNIKWVMFVHTTGRFSKYKSAASEYIRIEEFVMNSGINYTIIRPTMIFGSKKDRNIYKLIDYLYKHRYFPVFGKGANLMQPIHAKDLGNAVLNAYINKEKVLNKCYNVAGKFPITYKALLTSISKNLNKSTVFIHIPYGISLIVAHIYNLFFKNSLISVEQVMRMNEDRNFCYDDATKDFGYNPISFEQGIIDEVNEYLNDKNSI